MEKEKKDQTYGKKISPSETNITIALAEHLLGKLAPGQSFVIYGGSKNKGNCKCGCEVTPNYGSTGIGMNIIMSHKSCSRFIINIDKLLVHMS